MAERDRVQELIQRYLEQALSSDELRELDRALGASRAAAADLAEACRIDEYLTEHFAQRRRTIEVTAILDADRSQTEPPARTSARPLLRRLPLPWIAAAAVVLLTVGALLLGRLAHQPGPPQPQAHKWYEVVSGHVLIDGVRSQAVPAGAHIVVPSSGPAVLRLSDGSRAELAPSSEAIVRAPGHGTREALELLEGRGRFQAAQGRGLFRVDTLLGSVTALGTDFTVEFRSVEPRAEVDSDTRTTGVKALTVAVALGRVQVDFGTQTCVLSAGERRVFAAGVRDEDTCGPPPPPKPAPRSSAGGLPALPLPATPQRHTEKKKPPSPPVVVVKIKAGAPVDWATDHNDINTLLTWMETRLKINFACEEKTLSELELHAARMPMLYRTGHHAFTFTPRERERLRQYVLKGGFIFFDACCGRKAFADSARKELARIFPERPLHKLPSDHPVYRCYYDVPMVRYTPATGIQGLAAPPLEGIDVDCRTAVVFSPYDLSCGWDMHTHKTSAGVQAEHALKLGANLIAYATATKAMGRSLAESRVYVDKERSRADKFRIGQVVHNGQWNPDPAGLSTLLDTVSTTSSMKVSFATKPLKLDSSELTSYPFIYMTGHGGFQLSTPEAAALREYLEAGGFLMADACCGRKAFDVAFRREMKRVLPDAKLTALDPSHPIYSVHYKIGRVAYTQAAIVQKNMPSPSAPRLEGIRLNGNLAVVYSPVDMGCGWELKPHPFGVGYEPRDAVRLGVNIVMYAVTH